MKRLYVYIPDELEEILKEMPNKSEFVRDVLKKALMERGAEEPSEPSEVEATIDITAEKKEYDDTKDVGTLLRTFADELHRLQRVVEGFESDFSRVIQLVGTSHEQLSSRIAELEEKLKATRKIKESVEGSPSETPKEEGDKEVFFSGESEEKLIKRALACVPRDGLVRRKGVEKVLSKHASEDVIENILNNLIEENKIIQVQQDGQFYLKMALPDED